MEQAGFEHLGDWAASTSLEDVPEAAREVARRAIVDYVGVTLAAGDGDVAALLRAYRGSGNDTVDAATLIGQQASAPAETAAFINGALGHALDFDDCNEALGGHPTIVIFPAALAAAEVSGATGAQVLEGYVVGFEVASKIGRAVNFTHYERGWHPTATLAVFGAAAAAARVMGLDGERTATALAIAASTAAGLKANFGTMTKPLQAGRAAQNGLFAAKLAQLGATANPAAFEADQGFGAVYQGLETVDLDRLLGPVDQPWDLIDTAVTVKRFPCCASTHGAIEAALSAREEVASPDDIASIKVWTHPRRLKHTDRPSVSTGFEGKFSVQYTVAVALQQGEIGMGDFTPEAVARGEVGELMGRLEAGPMPEERWGSDHFPAEVVVETTDGRTISRRVERPRGNGPELALSKDEVRAKFLDCTRSRQLPEPAAEELLAAVWRLDSIDDLTELTHLLA